MGKLGKRTKAAREAFAGKDDVTVDEAVSLVKANANAKFDETVDVVARFKPTTILSGHAPAAEGMSDQLMQLMSTVPSVEPFVGPDQQAVEAILAHHG